ncbi:MAG: SDR family oxidoreductase [Chlamydiota bacterium]
MKPIRIAKPEVGNALIACSKAGVNILTKCAALELGPPHIRVNAIAPGRTKTPSNQPLMKYL